MPVWQPSMDEEIFLRAMRARQEEEGYLDPGIGPMQVIAKPGVNLRELLRRQMFPLIRDKARGGGGEWTPMIKTSLDRVRKAKTGKPVSFVAHRQESGPGGPIPGRGVFYTAQPMNAESIDFSSKLTRSGGSRGQSIVAMKLENPLVVPHQVDALKVLLEKEGVPFKNIAKKLYDSQDWVDHEHLPVWYRQADKWIARAARKLGHDSIIYTETYDAVDLMRNAPR